MPKCVACLNDKEVQKYPCEVEYRSNSAILCKNKIYLCEKCFSPEKVFACKEHEKVIETTWCEWVGSCPNESPVYYSFPDLGIRRVRDRDCRNCLKTFQICKRHENTSPLKTKYCSKCYLQI